MEKNKTDFLKNDLFLKTMLYKYLLENNYIENGFATDIFEDFTYSNILSKWDTNASYGVIETKAALTDHEMKLCSDYILKGPSLKGADSIVFGQAYEEFSDTGDKKKNGRFYTPNAIIELMTGFCKDEHWFGKKVLDPSCGSGFFLSKAYDKIFDAGIKKGISQEDMHSRILSDMLYGIDLDEKGVFLSSIILSLKSKRYIRPKNLCVADFLVENNQWKDFDIVIGNPPYIGHKQMDRDYFKCLRKLYYDVYYDKADMSYCFFRKGWDVLADDGCLIFITSRYFLEAHSGKGIRSFIRKNFKIREIIDYNGYRIIPGAKVDPLITVLDKNTNSEDNIKVHKYNGIKDTKLIYDRSKDAQSEEYFDVFAAVQKNLDDNGWILIGERQSEIIQKIFKKTHISLSSIWESRQGIITGCDKAFIIDDHECQLFDKGIVKPWIKNSNITAYKIKRNNKFLLYTDSVKEMSKYPELEKKLNPYMDKLKNRRECKKGIRPWHHLQWGRRHENFIKDKVVYPYKAHSNKFALDTNSSYFSADVYSFRLRDSYEYYTLKAITALLNSALYEFYFKTMAKKLGENLYEYYPNTVGRLKLPIYDEKFFARLQICHDSIASAKTIDGEIGAEEELNILVFDYFNIDKAQAKLIERSINHGKLRL
jgi:adenine-specific DNA-methyltransferase